MLLAFQLIGGLILLTLGADWLVRGASRLALAAGLTPLVIGLTVVAFGTSTPELVTSIVAGLQGQGTIAITNIVGSNIGNIALIMALAAIIRPLPVQSIMVQRDLPVMLLTSILLMAAIRLNFFGVAAGILFVALIIAFTIWQVRTSRLETEAIQAEFDQEIGELEGAAVKWPLWLASLVTLGGLATLVIGAQFLVESAVAIAQSLGVSERVIGLTIVAIGTSLPELAATLMATIRNEPDVAVGNIVGSNIFNILFIGGVVAITGQMGAPAPGLTVDLWIMVIVSAVSCAMLLTQHRLSRPEGSLLLLGYLGYLAWLILS